MNKQAFRTTLLVMLALLAGPAGAIGQEARARTRPVPRRSGRRLMKPSYGTR